MSDIDYNDHRTPAEPTDSILADHPLLYRVHDDESPHKLSGPGFTSNTPLYKPFETVVWSDSEWLKRLKKHKGLWKESDTTTKALIARVADNFAIDRESDWISTTDKIHWAIWQVAFRLGCLRRKSVWLSVIEPESEEDGANAMFRDAVINVAEVVSRYNADLQIKKGSKEFEEWSKTLNVARASGEKAYLGRIRANRIVQTTKWTRREPGFPIEHPIMQQHFKLMSASERRLSGGWLKCMVYNPHIKNRRRPDGLGWEGGFKEAGDRMQDRLKEIEPKQIEREKIAEKAEEEEGTIDLKEIAAALDDLDEK